VVATLAVTGSASVGTHTIRPSETLGGIARQHGTTVSALAAANGIRDPDHIIAGRVLRLPGVVSAPSSPQRAGGGSVVHVVAFGETLSGIARRHRVSVRAVAEANGVADIDRIRAGRRLLLPEPAQAGPGGALDTSTFPQRLRSRPERLALVPHFQSQAARHGVPLDLLMALAWVESGWQNDVVSRAGAQGIGQLMPSTVAFVSEVLLRRQLNPALAEENIAMSARYLRWLLDRTHGDERLALAGYFQGPASVRDRGVLPVSDAYVALVQAVRAVYFS
jgi:LysM repeat protein